MKRLNIFVDETGEFGFGKGASELYGISFTFHEQRNDIKDELTQLNQRLNRIGYSNMIHMADLIMGRTDYTNFSIKKRKSIFNAIYTFTKRISIKYKTIIIDKRFLNNKSQLRTKIIYEINKLIDNNIEYFEKFNKIVLYYDNGQDSLTTILESIFSRFSGFVHKENFNKRQKRLFQVSDMLTYIDKYDYKYKNKMTFSKSEDYFFTKDQIRKILKELKKNRF